MPVAMLPARPLERSPGHRHVLGRLRGKRRRQRLDHDITMRVPVERYAAVINKILALGELTSRTESSQDVTADVVDVNSRVKTMTASVARIRTLLSKATRIGDVIAIESELAVREADLESLEQQQASLGGRSHSPRCRSV